MVCMIRMDASESQQAVEKQLALETNKNGTARHSQAREIGFRYRLPAASAPTRPKRCPSPNARRTSPTSTTFSPKRAVSAERKVPSRSSSPPQQSPSTPVQDTSAVLLLASKRTTGNKLPDSLWPSTMRTLNVSFQSDTISVPASKREKPVPNTLSERTLRPSTKPASHNLTDCSLRPSSNIALRQAEKLSSRKSTPERKRSPNHSSDQSENSIPTDILHDRLMDPHRLPGRTNGKVSSTSLNRSIELTDKVLKIPSSSHSRIGVPSRRLSLDSQSKFLQKPGSDLRMLISRDDSSKNMLNRCTVVDNLPNSRSSNSSDKTPFNPGTRAESVPSSGFRHPSPSVSRGVSPSRIKVPNPSTGGPSPARTRPSSPSRQCQHPTSVLSFIVDIKKGKKTANHIEDVHQLRLLYNRNLQWRYANAQTDAALHSQKVKVEETFNSMCWKIVYLLDLVTAKRIDLQQLRLKLKLYSVLKNQLISLSEWDSVEGDHTNSLDCAIRGLQASTTRIPVTVEVKVDIETVKAAIFSAVDVMKATGSFLCSVGSQVQGMTCLITELADIAAQEVAMLDQCASLMGFTASFQAQESSLRTHVLQTE